MGGFGSKVIDSPQRKMEIMTLYKTGLGTPALSGSCASFCSVVDNGVGDYTINFDLPYAQIPEVFVQPITDDIAATCPSASRLVSGVKVLTTDMAGTAAEGDFMIMIVGCRARDLIGN